MLLVVQAAQVFERAIEQRARRFFAFPNHLRNFPTPQPFGKA
jgi:hypothetical protein